MALVPIARINCVPHQRIDSTHPLRIGAVAFHKSGETLGNCGISKVEFTVAGTGAGAGYSGTNPKTATVMSVNPDTTVPEFWVTFSSSEFASNGEITIGCKVTSLNDGSGVGVQDQSTYGTGRNSGMEDLKFVVNVDGNLPALVAWVDPNASGDGGGAVGNSAAPYQHIGAAATALQTAMNAAGNGSKVDGCIIKLKAGTHLAGGTAQVVTTSTEWLKITRDVGLTQSQVTLKTGYQEVRTTLLKVDGITMVDDTAQAVIPEQSGHYLWMDGVFFNGTGIGNSGSIPTSGSNTWAHVYLTNSRMDNLSAGTANYYMHFLSNVQMNHLGNDASQGVHHMVKVRVDWIDYTGGVHCDFFGDIQADENGDCNRIYFMCWGTNLEYNGFLCNSTSPPSGASIQGVAVVNCAIENRVVPPGSVPDGFNGYYFEVAHFLWWNNTLTNTLMLHDDTGSVHSDNTDLNLVGNCIYQFQPVNNSNSPSNGSAGSGSNNHFQVTAGGSTWGSSGITTGATGLDMDTASPTFLRPQAGSVLLNKTGNPPPVPFDVAGTARPTTNWTGGAFEMNPPPPTATLVWGISV